ncbi:hypothetical protein KSP9073_00679 [Kushneria phyllosphaerae]|uniref:Uncharacterized protein n=1 Tax=Kushneria phyllosphaerae TaxID=2100822 RepID=A0A2R8CID5_9GAMM|nr:hypothetical protein KSP9073_00679 [Kushneria phyllosphaerae]
MERPSVAFFRKWHASFATLCAERHANGESFWQVVYRNRNDKQPYTA